MLGSRVQGVGFTEKRSGPMSGSQKEGPFQGPFLVRVLPSFGVLKKGPEQRAISLIFKSDDFFKLNNFITGVVVFMNIFNIFFTFKFRNNLM